jgi:7-cyano-7-deazaguanine synthase
MAGATTLVAGGDEVPELAALDAAQRRQPPTYVPNRNLTLLALAAAYAEARGCHRVFYGAQAQDEYGYWDCTAEFVERTNAVLALNRHRPVRIEAPFCRLTKAAEIAIGRRLGVDFAHTWSCYRGGDRPCGACPTCVERAQAFQQAGLADPLAAGDRL